MTWWYSNRSPVGPPSRPFEDWPQHRLVHCHALHPTLSLSTAWSGQEQLTGSDVFSGHAIQRIRSVQSVSRFMILKSYLTPCNLRLVLVLFKFTSTIMESRFYKSNGGWQRLRNIGTHWGNNHQQQLLPSDDMEWEHLEQSLCKANWCRT